MIWLPILDYEDFYEINNSGIIRSINRTITCRSKSGSTLQRFFKGKVIYQHLGKRDGYYLVTLCKHGTQHTFAVHSLVAKHFIPNPNNLPEVNHINGIKTNNCVDNLEWSTESENQKHAYRLGLRTSDSIKGSGHGMSTHSEDEIFITKLLLETCKDMPQTYLAKTFNLDESTINKIKNETTWSHVILQEDDVIFFDLLCMSGV